MKCTWEAEGKRRGRQPTQMEQECTRSEYVSGSGTGGMRGRAASALSADATHKWKIGTATGACMCAANDQQPSRVEHTRTRTEPNQPRRTRRSLGGAKRAIALSLHFVLP